MGEWKNANLQINMGSQSHEGIRSKELMWPYIKKW